MSATPTSSSKRGYGRLIMVVLLLGVGLTLLYLLVSFVWAYLYWLIAAWILAVLIFNRKRIEQGWRVLRDTFNRNPYLGISVGLLAILLTPLLVVVLTFVLILDRLSKPARPTPNAEEAEAEVIDSKLHQPPKSGQ